MPHPALKQAAGEALGADGAFDHPVDSLLGGDGPARVAAAEEAGSNDGEDVASTDSGAAAEAVIPGISFCCASAAEANKKMEQLNL